MLGNYGICEDNAHVDSVWIYESNLEHPVPDQG